MLKKISFGFIFVLIAIQFYPIDRTNPPSTHPIILENADVEALLKRACYDCHSNETKWPAYGYVAPFSWLLLDDINEGRKHLNFSIYENYTVRKKHHKLDEIREEVELGNMPMDAYTFIHSEAELSDADKALLYDWVEVKMALLQLSLDSAKVK